MNIWGVWRNRRIRGERGGAVPLGVLAAVIAPSAFGQSPLEDPVPEAIGKGDLVVAVAPFVRAPRTVDQTVNQRRVSGTNNAYARVQSLAPVPVGAGAAPRRLAFNDARGVLYLTDAEGRTPTAYLDLRRQDVHFSNRNFPNESGFLGFAFHPEFAMPGKPGYGKLYTAFSALPGSRVADYADAGAVQHSVLREWTTEDASANVFRGTSREVLRVGQFASNHNVGTIAFNPAAKPDSPDYGNLYICYGDGGRRYDPADNGQTLRSPLGAIARIDPLDTAGGGAYGIPPDNPFVGLAGAAPEIWAYGLRHPQQFSWDADGRMFLTDIGQDQIEELNIGVAGANYGWRLREGTFATAHAVQGGRFGPVYRRPAADPAAFVYPVAQYDHDEGYAIGGGFVYRGRGIPSLRGKYVFTEFVRGRVFVVDAGDLHPDRPARIDELRLSFDGQERDLADVAGMVNTYQSGERRVDARIGIDHEGELYVLAKGNGWIYKLTALPGEAVQLRRLGLFLAVPRGDAVAGREGFVRVINRTADAGEVTIEAIDESGRRAPATTLAVGAGETRHFNSRDLENGSAAKGLAGVGQGQGDWRLELSMPVGMEALAYMRTNAGFLTSLHETAGPPGRGHEVVFFNPGSNEAQVSELRLVNAGEVDATVTITGRDDIGEVAPGGPVTLTVAAGATATATAAQLEGGADGIDGALGDGQGKWRLAVSADEPIQVMSLLESPTGDIANLSTRPGPRPRPGAGVAIPYFPADDGRLEGFARIVNHSDVEDGVLIHAIDDDGVQRGPLTLELPPNGVRHFNSRDLVNGNPRKGLSGGVGAGVGALRLSFETELAIEALAYIRTRQGFVTAMHDVVPAVDGRHDVRIFNPASNLRQASWLRLVNPGETDAQATITGIDDAGMRGEMEVRLWLPAGTARALTATQLEEGHPGMEGSLGDRTGKWRLEVSADQPIRVMSLLRNSTSITNLSTFPSEHP